MIHRPTETPQESAAPHGIGRANADVTQVVSGARIVGLAPPCSRSEQRRKSEHRRTGQRATAPLCPNHHYGSGRFKRALLFWRVPGTCDVARHRCLSQQRAKQ